MGSFDLEKQTSGGLIIAKYTDCLFLFKKVLSYEP